MIHLILGGARSGKSRYGQNMAEAKSPTPLYLATAEAQDAEMEQRIAQHQNDRDSQWLLHEEPIKLAQALEHLSNHEMIVVDCLTLWLSNCLLANCWDEQRSAFLEALPRLQSDLILISNDVGHGVVPMGQLSRDFVDQSGWLHQELAAQSDHVTMVIAGLPQQLK